MQARILQESRQDGGVRQSRKGARSQGDRSKDRRDKDKLKRTVPPSYPPPKMNKFMTALMNEARGMYGCINIKTFPILDNDFYIFHSFLIPHH